MQSLSSQELQLVILNYPVFVPGDPAVQIIRRVCELVHGEVQGPGWGYQLACVPCNTSHIRIPLWLLLVNIVIKHGEIGNE